MLILNHILLLKIILMQFNFPKVLIIGTYFDLASGGGITMSNLFRGWDKNRIAVASSRISHPDYSVCNINYQFGFAEEKRRFPFYLWQRKEKSGLIDTPIKSSSNSVKIAVSDSKKMKLYNDFLHFFGLYHYARKLQLSPEFTIWLKEFKPDIIYTQLSTLESIRFVSSLQSKFNIPVIVHIMDDWPSTISRKGILQTYWKNKIDKDFRSLIDKSKVLMSISDAMTDEYRIRYDKEFIPFHNPINVSYWSKQSKVNYNANVPFIILYSGRIGAGICNCFFDITKAIKELVDRGLNIEFQLQSTSNSFILKEISKYSFVKIKTPQPYDALPGLFASVDILLIPNDFDKKSIAFLKYSMPTKASEYMVTGTPILLYADEETAIVKHARRNKWGYIVSENNPSKLATAITELYENEDLRKELGQIARQYASENYCDIKVNKQFLKSFAN